MRAFVRFKLPDGSTVELGPGDVIGRHASTALVLDDVRVSEAHALVSLRGDALKLLSLRGRFALGGKPLSELSLAPGQVIEPARGLRLVVEAVELPEAVMALRGDRLAQQILSSTNALFMDPQPNLRTRYASDAEAWIWGSGESWRLRVGDGDPLPFGVGDTFTIGQDTFEAVLAPLRASATTIRQTGLVPPLRIVARYDTVHIHQAGAVVLSLNGISARLISELVITSVPMGWEALAREVWPQEPERIALRRKLDTNLGRLRHKLRNARLRADLVRTDGRGHVELLLLAGDTVEDQT